MPGEAVRNETDKRDAGDAQLLSGILLQALSDLAMAGQIETACRLAGRACVMLRHSDPSTARRFDVLLHRLTPALTW